jgi:hypothetical protein
MAEGLSAASGKMKTINEGVRENEFKSRSEYLAHQVQQRLARGAATEESAAKEKPEGKSSGSTDNKNLREMNASLKTIQSIVKGIAIHSEKHLKSIAKKLDKATKPVGTTAVPKASPMLAVAGDSKEKIVSQRHLSSTAAWQSEVVRLLKKLALKQGVNAPTRKRSSRSMASGKGFTSDLAKHLATGLLGVTAGALVGGLVASVVGATKSILGGVAGAILTVGKLAVVGLVSGATKLLGGIASVILNIGKSVATTLGTGMSKLAVGAMDFLKGAGAKAADVGKTVVKEAAKVVSKVKPVVAAGAKATQAKAAVTAAKSALVAKSIGKVVAAKTRPMLAAAAKAVKAGSGIVGKALRAQVPRDIAKAKAAGQIVTAALKNQVPRDVAKLKSFVAKSPKAMALINAGAQATAKARNALLPVAKAAAASSKVLVASVGTAMKKAAPYVGAAADTAKDVTKGAASKIAAKVGAKAGSKGIAKTLGKSILKKVPFIGAAAGIGFGINRAMHGDYKGAAAEVGSGLASTVPGIGTAASIGADAWLIKHDIDIARQTKLKVAKTGVTPMTRQLEASQERNEEVRTLREKKQDDAATVVQSSSTTNNIQAGGGDSGIRLSTRNPDTTAEFLRRLSLSSTMIGQGFVIN